MQMEQLKSLVLTALADLKAVDVRELDVRAKSSFTDIMIVASGRTDRQVKALAQEVVQRAKAEGVLPLGVEGEREGEWIVVDLGDVVLHVMQPRIRDFYNLEKLWGEESPDEG